MSANMHIFYDIYLPPLLESDGGGVRAYVFHWTSSDLVPRASYRAPVLFRLGVMSVCHSDGLRLATEDLNDCSAEGFSNWYYRLGLFDACPRPWSS
jgi:hypothetical protein